MHWWSDVPRLPGIGDKVLLLRCDRPTRERLRIAGCYGGKDIDRDGGDPLLNKLLRENASPARLAEWVDGLRNEAIAAGTIPTLWLANPTEPVIQRLRDVAGVGLVEVV